MFCVFRCRTTTTRSKLTERRGSAAHASTRREIVDFLAARLLSPRVRCAEREESLPGLACVGGRVSLGLRRTKVKEHISESITGCSKLWSLQRLFLYPCLVLSSRACSCFSLCIACLFYYEFLTFMQMTLSCKIEVVLPGRF